MKIFYENEPHFIKQKQNLVRTVALSYIFANTFHVQLNRRWLESPICFCIQCHDRLFWLKYKKKIWPSIDMYLEKAGLL